MEALAAYSSSDDEGSVRHPSPVAFNPEHSASVLSNLKERCKVQSAPDVPVKLEQTTVLRIDPTAKEVTFNPTYEQLFAPQVGPMNPFKSQQQLAQKNILSGHMEPAHFDAFQFENQRRTYHIHGYAIDPSVVEGMAPQSTPFVGDLEQAGEFEGATVFEMKGSQKVGEKRKREQPGDSDKVEGYKGPWRQYVDEVKVAKPTEAQKLILDQMIHSKKRKEKEQKEETIDETTELHIEDPHDYLGRSFLHIPQDVDVDLRAEDPPEKCYAPKKLLHTWNAHAKGVAAIRLFPKSGHLMLSAGMDSKIKLWEVYKDKRCIRTYTGHGKAVRDICFNSDGSQFISCSYDRYVKQWDTETGKCLGRFTNENKTTPYCIKLNPDPDKQHLFIVGCADKKIYTWDMKSGEIVQEYDRHLGSVNSVTFVDENRRFVSTSDDKSLRVWEWDIPVDMKYIAEPHMHSMPSVTLHPNGKWIACQSMDNQIKVYGVHNNFRLNRKKTFRGHIVAGYACQTDFSPDGSFVLSGDADGKLTLWEWKTTRIFTRFKAHDKVCIGCQWLPHETSKVVTCGWDGFIKLWD